jgi:hypothetical protein
MYVSALFTCAAAADDDDDDDDASAAAAAVSGYACLLPLTPQPKALTS